MSKYFLLLKTTTGYGQYLWHSIYAIIKGVKFFVCDISHNNGIICGKAEGVAR